MNPTSFVSKAAGCLQRTVKKFDLFSQKIMFTYKGESSFSTFLGGLVSIAILSIVGVYFIILLQAMINREKSNISKSTKVVDLSIEDEDYYPVNYGFTFGIALTDTVGRPFKLDPTLFTIDFYQSTFTKIGDIYQPVKTSLGYKLCEFYDFNLTNKEYITRGLSSALYCPAKRNYRIAGNYLANNFQYMTVSIIKCKGDGCQPLSIVDATLQQIIVSVSVLNNYMDFNDYSTPIKSHFDDRNSFHVLPTFTKQIKIYLKLSEANE